MMVRTPMCEGEELLDQGAVRMTGGLRVPVGLQSHAPIKPNPPAPTAVIIPRHLRGTI